MSSRCPGVGAFFRIFVPSLVGGVRSRWENRRAYRWEHPEINIGAVRHDHEPRAPSELLWLFLVLFARWYMVFLGQALRLMPSVALAVLRGVVQRLVLPLVALDMDYAQLHTPAPAIKCDDAQFFFGNGSAAATTTSSEEKRMLRHMLAFFKKVQKVIRADGPMGTADKARAVGALVAGKTATIRTCGLPFNQINALLVPVLEVTAVLRRRTGVPPITDARRAYLLGQVFQRADALENCIAQALWVEAWPTVPADMGTVCKADPGISPKTRGTEFTPSPAAHCGPRRRASASVNPRATHLRGSGAVVVT